jgi:hypothetical protein
MWDRILPVVTAWLVIAGGSRATAGDPAPGVTLRLTNAEAERGPKYILFHCYLELDNETGHELKVRSNFSSAFDGLELVITDRDGKVLAQQSQMRHKSPANLKARDFPLKTGRTKEDVVFPIDDLPVEAKAFKVRLVGTLLGSGYDRILSTETMEVEVKK